MKTIKIILCMGLIASLSACSKQEEEPQAPVEERVSNDPQTRYGKAIQQTEQLTRKVEADRAEAEAMLDE